MKQSSSHIMFIALLVIISGCAVAPERHREARLMPEKVAAEIIAKSAGSDWVKNPTGVATLANHPFCGDHKKYPMPFKSMFISWSTIDKYVAVGSTESEGATFVCGSQIAYFFKYSSIDQREDLLDALISMGAKIRTN
jgi:hypothetical protein